MSITEALNETFSNPSENFLKTENKNPNKSVLKHSSSKKNKINKISSKMNEIKTPNSNASNRLKKGLAVSYYNKN
jgi:hypothetical protein